MTVRHKVLAYITHGSQLLVFRHPESPSAGVQVPAGTIEPGEDPAQAVLREAFEETGLADLRMVSKIGFYHYHPSPDVVHERHVYHLEVTGEVAEKWRHYERNSNTSAEVIPFDFFWVDLIQDKTPLAGGHGDMLALLRRELRITTGTIQER